MICKQLSLTTTPKSLLELLGIDPLMRGGMTVRMQVQAGTVNYGNKAAQLMIETDETDLEVINAKELYLVGLVPAVVNILVIYSRD